MEIWPRYTENVWWVRPGPPLLTWTTPCMTAQELMKPARSLVRVRSLNFITAIITLAPAYCDWILAVHVCIKSGRAYNSLLSVGIGQAVEQAMRPSTRYCKDTQTAQQAPGLSFNRIKVEIWDDWATSLMSQSIPLFTRLSLPAFTFNAFLHSHDPAYFASVVEVFLV